LGFVILGIKGSGRKNDLPRISPFLESPYFTSSLKGSYFAQPPEVARGLTELGVQKGLDEIPSHGWPNGPSAHAKDIHVIVLRSLPCREMVVNKAGADAANLVCTDRRTDAAPANCHATIHLPRHEGLGEGNHKVGIVVVGGQAVGTEVDDLVSCGVEAGGQILF
jgi:hypothetical protein